MFYLFYKFPLITGFSAGLALTSLFAFYQKEESRDCAISRQWENGLYIGIDNPVTVLTSGMPEELVQVTVDGSGATLEKQSARHYLVRTEQPGEITMTVSDGGSWKQSFQFRSTRIPDPKPLLGARYTDKSLDAATFKAQLGLAAAQNQIAVDIKCDISTYSIKRFGKKDDGITVNNIGAKFGPSARELVDKAEKGDQYYFEDIKTRCPGDKVARDLGALSFQIK